MHNNNKIVCKLTWSSLLDVFFLYFKVQISSSLIYLQVQLFLNTPEFFMSYSLSPGFSYMLVRYLISATFNLQISACIRALILQFIGLQKKKVKLSL
jgi:hypothetical protein